MKTFEDIMADHEASKGTIKEVPVKAKILPKHQGYVYVLTNSAIPHMVKVGVTRKSPEERAESLSSSSNMPTSFRVEFSKLVLFPFKVERRVHKKLTGKRVNARREFFRCSVEDAALAIETIAFQVERDEGYCNINKKLRKNA